MRWEQLILSRLFLAIPEIEWDDVFMHLLVKKGFISQEYMDSGIAARKSFKKVTDTYKRMSGETIMGRIMIVMPEIISVRTVDFLASIGLLKTTEAHALRIALRAKGALEPVFVSRATFTSRMSALYDVVFSHEMINLVRSIDNERIIRYANMLRGERTKLTHEDAEFLKEFLLIPSIRKAQAARGGVTMIAVARKTAAELNAANGVYDSITVVMSNVFSERFLGAAIRMGLIPERSRKVILALEDYGMNVWRKVGKSFEYESWAARALLITEGVLSPELVRALRETGLISKELAAILNPASGILRDVLRAVGDRYSPSRRIRVVPGESPLETFVRTTGMNDKAMLKLLAQSAKQSGQIAGKYQFSKETGKAVRGAQQRLVQIELHNQMRILTENMGFVIIAGEKQAALAGADAMDALLNKFWGRTAAMQDMKLAVQFSARAGIESFASRRENTIALSKRVYNLYRLGTGQVNNAVNRALLRNLNARDFAKSIENMINPNTPGGVSYAATRLARTEINNAFHFSQVRYTREMPWVDGYKWNRSGRSHSTDICADYASKDHDNLGPGVFSKRNVPGKPHPQCLCFLTTVTVDPKRFATSIRQGSYDSYFQESYKAMMQKDPWIAERANSIFDGALPAAKETLYNAAAGVASQAVQALIQDWFLRHGMEALRGAGALDAQASRDFWTALRLRTVTGLSEEDAARYATTDIGTFDDWINAQEVQTTAAKVAKLKAKTGMTPAQSAAADAESAIARYLKSEAQFRASARAVYDHWNSAAD